MLRERGEEEGGWGVTVDFHTRLKKGKCPGAVEGKGLENEKKKEGLALPGELRRMLGEGGGERT